MKRKLLAVATALWAVLLSIPAMAQSWPENVNCIIVGSEAKIKASPDAKGEIVIPSSVTVTLGSPRPKTIPVTGILSAAFKGCTKLTSIELPAGIKSIGDSAFFGCTALTTVNIPDSLTEISPYTFYNCSKIKEVVVTDKVETIGKKAFDNCSVLHKITFGKSVYQLGESVMDGSRQIDTVVSLAEYPPVLDGGLLDDYQGSTLLIPTPIAKYWYTYPGAGEWHYFDNIVVMDYGTWPKGVEFSINDEVPQPYEITIEKSPEAAGAIVIPESLMGEDGLHVVVAVADSAFFKNTAITSIQLPNTITSLGRSVFNTCYNLTKVVLPENKSITQIPRYFFHECSKLVEVNLPRSVETIDMYAFSRCIGLASVILPESLKTISNYAFSSALNLTSITFPDSVEHIMTAAFYDARKLAEITIGKNLTSIRNYAFKDCPITKITVHAEEPPAIAAPDAFSDYTATLYVPDTTAKAAYAAAPYWKNFAKIEVIPVVVEVATPTFSVPAGAVVKGTSVTIACETTGATIYYTTDGSAPTSRSTEYTKPVVINEALTLKAIAFKGEDSSRVATAAYTVKEEGGETPTDTVATPTFSVPAGAVVKGTPVTIACETTGATIYYTTDGSAPTSRSTKYTTPVVINEALTLKAIAFKGTDSSRVATAAYTVKEEGGETPTDTVATPTFSVPAGAVVKGTPVTIACETTGATIYYTTDGSAPTSRSTKYTTPVVINEALTLKAIAFKGEDSSRVATAAYTIKEEVTKYTVRLKVNNAEWGKVEGAGEFEAGSEVTIKAIANEGYNFVVWKDSNNINVSSTANYTFKLEKDVTLTAIFTEETANDATELSGVSIYPNPSNGEFTLDLPAAASIEVFAANGILHRRMEACAGNITLNIERSGIYFLRITAKERTTIKRVVVR